MQKNIPIQNLESFLVYAHFRNMISAAKSLGLTQGALSKRLHAFESCLGAPLFSTQGRQKVLTPQGRQLYEKLYLEYLQLTDSLAGALKEIQSFDQLHIKLAARREILDRLGPQLDSNFSFHFVEATHDELQWQLSENKIDLAISHVRPDSLQIVSKLLFRENFQFVMSRKLLSSQGLQNLPVLAYKADDQILQSYCETMDLNFKELRIHRITDNYSSLASMVAAGLGWSILPTHYPFSRDSFVIKRFEPPARATRQFYLLYRKERSKAPWLRNLIYQIQRVAF